MPWMPPSLDMRASRHSEPLQGVGARHARGTSPLCVALLPLRALAVNHDHPLNGSQAKAAPRQGFQITGTKRATCVSIQKRWR